jgi:hypothetical protein
MLDIILPGSKIFIDSNILIYHFLIFQRAVHFSWSESSTVRFKLTFPQLCRLRSYID